MADGSFKQSCIPSRVLRWDVKWPIQLAIVFIHWSKGEIFVKTGEPPLWWYSQLQGRSPPHQAKAPRVNVWNHGFWTNPQVFDKFPCDDFFMFVFYHVDVVWNDLCPSPVSLGLGSTHHWHCKQLLTWHLMSMSTLDTVICKISTLIWFHSEPMWNHIVMYNIIILIYNYM